MTLTKKTRPARRQAPHFKSKFITTELARVFSQSDSEDEEFQGFSDQEDKSRGFSKRLKDMKVESEEDSDVDIGFYSDGEEDDDDPPPKRSLCVAMRFPIKRLSTPTTQEVPQKRAKKAAAARAPPPPPSRRSSRRPLKQEEEKDLRKAEMQPRVLLSQILKKGEKEPRVLLSQILKEEKRQKQETLSQKLKEEKRQKQETLSQKLKEEKRLKQETLSQKLKEEKRQKQETLSQKLKEEERQQQEVQSQSLTKRNKNIQENKAMLAKLFSELSTMAELTPLNTPQKKPTAEKTTPRKRRLEAEAGSERRNPSRKARPPENFGVEERSVSPSRGPRTVDIRRLVEVDEERMDGGGRKKRKSCVRSPHSRRYKYVMKSVDDITKEDLDNIAYRAKDKIWDKENGSSCHQCRQKTLDTKTVCRSGFCNAGKGQFCGPCLKNRYGEDVGTVLLDPTWSCPICRNVCNCSLCRKKEGRCATGILVGLARFNGHDNVHEYLERIQKELS